MGDKDDDDGADEGSGNIVRYNIMPSLVGLQLMRNRLHLAHTGKKLMKWTALATGRELRKLSKEIVQVYDTFREDMRQCFILLARARYFNPYVNDIVVNNPANRANIKVEKSYKSISGVKVVQLLIHDDGLGSYNHLGIGRGGIVIGQAKNAWRDLLKRVIFMSQEREDFTGLEMAHKNANKRQNVITKVVIPKLKLTIRYILSELEEKEREDTFRLKRFKELKIKKEKRKKGSDEVSPTCGPGPGEGGTDNNSLSKNVHEVRKMPSDESGKKVVINTNNPKVIINTKNLKNTTSRRHSVSSFESPETINSFKVLLEDSRLCKSCKNIVSDTLLGKEPSHVQTVDKSTSEHVKDACTGCNIEDEPKQSDSIISSKPSSTLSGVQEGDKDSKLIMSTEQACGCQVIKIIPSWKCDWLDEIFKVNGPGKFELKADILENIKNIILSPSTHSKSCVSCQTNLSENEIEIHKCKSCGTLSASIKSCKSNASETKSSKSFLKQKGEKRKPPPKHKCDLESTSSRSSIASSKNKNTSKCDVKQCCLKQKGEKRKPPPKHKCDLESTSSRSSIASSKNKDTSKCDVREAKSCVTNMKKPPNDCCCKSDTTLIKNKNKN